MPSLLIDHIDMYRDLYNFNERTGRLELDILFKTVDFLEKYKKLRVVLQEVEIMQLEAAGPWDPLNPPTAVKLQTLITEPETGDYANAFIVLNRDIFIPGPGRDDSESLKKVLGKVNDEMYAAIRVAEAICKQYKELKWSYLHLKREYINDWSINDDRVVAARRYWQSQMHSDSINSRSAAAGQSQADAEDFDLVAKWADAKAIANW